MSEERAESTAPRQIILLTIDAWRHDFVDEYEGVRLTPALDRYADHTVRFERMYANGPWTTPGLISMFTGEHPGRHGVHYAWSTPRPGGPALARRFQDIGWRTPNLMYLNAVDNYANLGYEASEAPAAPQDPRDPALCDAIAATAGGTYLWYHYKFVHLPYWAAERYRARFDIGALPARLRDSVASGFVVPRQEFALESGDGPVVRRMYAAGVLEMNSFLERVFDAVEASGRWDDTTIVITADHGEELLERGHVGHASTAHHGMVFDELMRIPLIVIDRRIRAPRRVQARVQGTDLYPTVLGLAGLNVASNVTSDDADGTGAVDLSPCILGDGEPGLDPDRLFYYHSSRMGYLTPRACEGQVVEAVTDGRYKYIVENYEQPRRMLFDMRIDPGETRPIDDVALLDRWSRILSEIRN